MISNVLSCMSKNKVFVLFKVFRLEQRCRLLPDDAETSTWIGSSPCPPVGSQLCHLHVSTQLKPLRLPTFQSQIQLGRGGLLKLPHCAKSLQVSPSGKRNLQIISHYLKVSFSKSKSLSLSTLWWRLQQRPSIQTFTISIRY